MKPPRPDRLTRSRARKAPHWHKCCHGYSEHVGAHRFLSASRAEGRS